jgi:hypothetical protein
MKRAPSPLLLGVGAALCVTLGALLAVWFGGRRSRGSDPPPVADSEVWPAAGAHQPHRSPPRDPGGMRAEIQRATTRALAEVKPADLERYLDSLEQRARAQGQVTALELEPGRALAESVTGDQERANQFGRRMERVQRELSGAPAAAVPSAASVEALAARINAETDNQRRQALIREYMDAAQALPDEEQPAAIQRINRIIAAMPPAAPPGNPDDLYRAIAEAEPRQRQAAIMRYLEAVEALPDEEERARRVRALDRVQGAPAAAPR